LGLTIICQVGLKCALGLTIISKVQFLNYKAIDLGMLKHVQVTSALCLVNILRWKKHIQK
jgi:hypothetical protein